MATNKIEIELSAIDRNLKQILGQTEQAMGKFSATTQRLDSGLGSIAGTFGKVAAPLTALLSATAGLTKLVEVTREFDKINAALLTSTGSADKAAIAFQALEDFATKTPFDLQQVSQGFIKLVNMGLDPSERALNSYGNTAASMGKSLNQMIEAVADAATGEFERLKEFGVKAKSEGDKVTFTFRGVATTVGKNAAEIEQYLLKLGENNFAGAMTNRMDTLDGAMSNLGDSWDKLFRTISDNGIGSLIESGVRTATEALDALSATIKDVAAAYRKLFDFDVSQAISTIGGPDAWNDFAPDDAQLNRVELTKQKIKETQELIAKFDPARLPKGVLEERQKTLAGLQTLLEEQTNLTSGQINLAPDGVKKRGDRLAQFGLGVSTPPSPKGKKSKSGGNSDLDAARRQGEQFYQQTLDKLLPLEKAQREYNEQLAALNLMDPTGTTERYQEALGNLNAELQKAEAAHNGLAAARAAAESNIALRESQLAEQQAAGTVTATEALRIQVGLLQEKQKIQQDYLDSLPSATSEESISWNAQATRLSQTNKDLAELGARLRQTDGWEGLKQGLKDVTEQGVSMGESIRSAVTQSFASMDDAIANFVVKGKLEFGDLVDSILADFAKLAVRQSITGPLAAGLNGLLSGMVGGVTGGSSGGSVNIGAFMPEYAMGGVVRSIGLSAYTNSIVNRPTVFPFAKGVGLMGEAGPEAIMPLKRTASGNLGVETSGGSGVVINVIESPGNGGKQERHQENGVNQINIFVEQIKASIAGDIARGSGSIPSALGNTYGMNRAAGAY
jgi:lambda family phage tail tape measure protein